MSQEQVANYVVLTIVVGALVIGLISMLVGKVVALFDWTRDQMTSAVERERNNMSSKRARYIDTREVQNWPEMPVSNRTNEPSNPPNLASQSGSAPRTGALELSPQEVAAVSKMIEHKASAEKPTKASTIWAGFAIKKGESTRYKRASEIYDNLFVVQPEFPALEANRQPRWDADQAPAH